MNPRNIDQLQVAGRSVRCSAKHDKTWWQPSNRGSKNWHSWHLDIWLQSVHMLRSSSSVFRWWSPAPKTVINIISGWKTELRQFKISRQHLINYLAHARCLCSLPQHFVFVCFAASHHLSVCHRTFQLYKHQQVDNNGFSLGYLTHLQQRRTKCAMRSILHFMKHFKMMNIIFQESNVVLTNNTCWIH